ncbi:MAG: thrombospondin type 3 repeat-containing protein [Deltaproteobacteria bacterium]|nr:thrombospondin type 3 repeat-containing protein [Deltaproteobacteria bacterium]
MIKMGKFGAAAELGFIYRPFADDSSFFGDKFQQGNQVVFGAGGWFRVLQQLHITAEISGRSGFSNNRHDHPLEGGVGASYEVMSGLYLQAGINVGIISGMGTPPFRVLFGVKWAPSFKDSDGDGVVDEQDKCPLIKEDKDGFEDEDGCPDPDNDKDGIPDVTDKCPNQAEDIDGFEDEDGCPDYDNDKDGIPDIKDNCPKDPGPKSKNGCPASHIDTDGDGVSDSVDKCPKDPGEKRYMGCTRETYDGDGDGVMDSEDKCPKHPGEAKYKGCPASMVDTDEDGVTDDKDKCPGKMETINGYKDDDGCPDKGKPWFSIAQIKILGMEKTGLTFKFPSRKAEWFENKTGGTLTKEGKNALGQFVLFMKSKKAIPKMALMILTDNTMSGDAAMKITKAQGEAVKKYVVSMGLSAARVVIQPMGNQIPAYKGKNRKKQIRNRRILFIILEN